ncbi:ArsR family transcriptional regulator [Pantoea sp. PNA 14-12]|uniref:ArsR/SmtB family transcription factor n=1 Tax=Pantoea TaxID=53335 RepID=UPI00050EE382|nr:MULTISPECIES: helix-turn-helix transcriptional regulator [Pantoea]KGD84950.1 ArsR family transcriptional regulator [Pantoea stewartii subsp. indologenes]TDS71973.1 ArsR family transcriptional regulator [Pantoea sp. PNA 14-12]
MNQFHISVVAHLIAEPVRSVMLIHLAGGEALSASALASAAGVTAQTASFHLAKLRDGGLISMKSVGRYRYYRLAGPHISQLLENLASVGTVSQQWKTTSNSSVRELRFARCCYDHLAGQIGVAITQGMLNRGLIVSRESQRYVLTDAGHRWLEQQGIEIPEQWEGNHRMCLDWTERQYHLAGPLASALLDAFVSWKWLSRLGKSRALKITPSGWKAFGHHFGLRQLQGNPTAE